MKNILELADEAYKNNRRIVAPLLGFSCVKMIGSNIKIAQQNYRVHFKVLQKVYEEFSPDIIFPLMDLSVEANALGRITHFAREKAPNVQKEEFKFEELDKLRAIDITTDARIVNYAKVVNMMSVGLPENVVKGAYVIGPYTLASLIMGDDTAAMATKLDKENLHKLCAFSTEKIEDYIMLLSSAGAEIICILEPTAALIGPVQYQEFSATYVKRIVNRCKNMCPNIVYHICGNTSRIHEKMAETGVTGLSLDSKQIGVKLEETAKKVPSNVLLIGNISPVDVMMNGTPEDVKWEVSELLNLMKPYPNFILSTGCNLPQETPIENIQMLMKTGRDHRIN